MIQIEINKKTNQILNALCNHFTNVYGFQLHQDQVIEILAQEKAKQVEDEAEKESEKKTKEEVVSHAVVDTETVITENGSQPAILYTDIMYKYLIKDIKDFDFDVRIARVFEAAYIFCIGQLLMCDERELKRLPNFGKKSLYRLHSILSGYVVGGTELQIGVSFPPDVRQKVLEYNLMRIQAQDRLLADRSLVTATGLIRCWNDSNPWTEQIGRRYAKKYLKNAVIDITEHLKHGHVS